MNPAITDIHLCTTKAFELHGSKSVLKRQGLLKKYIQERQMSTTNEFHEHAKINFKTSSQVQQ